MRLNQLAKKVGRPYTRVEKYIKKEVSLKIMEKLVVEKSLEDEYLKPYSGKPFKINDQ